MNSKQYLNKVKAERDSALSFVKYWQSRFEDAKAVAAQKTEVWEARLRTQQEEFNKRINEMQGALNIERQMALQISAERERGKIAEDRRFDFLANTLVMTAIATTQNQYPRPSGVPDQDFTSKTEIDKPIRLGTPTPSNKY